MKLESNLIINKNRLQVEPASGKTWKSFLCTTHEKTPEGYIAVKQLFVLLAYRFFLAEITRRRNQMARKRVTVTDETATGRNTRFHDNYNQNDMTGTLFVNQIRQLSKLSYS